MIEGVIIKSGGAPMTSVFEPAAIAGISLKNRIIRSATHEGMADEAGCPTDKLKGLYVRLAKGGVGAIITGYAGIQNDGKSSLFHMLMIDDDRFIPHYKAITDAVHEHGTSLILQIAHSGRQTRSIITGLPTVAPSAIRDKFYSEDMPRELTEDQIVEIIDNFVKAIGRAKAAGFDGVQIHGAHGYLLSEFMSPYSNKRTDRWGGSTENRFRIVGEIFHRARASLGTDYPILIKLNAYDGRKSGMRVDEAVKIAQMLEACGCSAIEVSCGTGEDGFHMSRGEKLPMEAVFRYNFKYKSLPPLVKRLMKPFASLISHPVKPIDNYNVEAAQKIKAKVSVPVIVVGGISTLPDIREILENRKADFVSMCRPFIIEPNLVKRFQEGKVEPSRCIRCNYCILAIEERPLRCYYGMLKD
jgi:2,4-dienoyl-CoA reductase-like NADH-dependent reductase (Old Yellow Enzyme family)